MSKGAWKETVMAGCKGSRRVLVAAALAAVPVGAFGAAPPTDVEQYALELINRARLDPSRDVYRLRDLPWGNTGSPAAPDLNEGLPGSTLFFNARAPLAFNTNLIQSSRDYSTTLLANDAFTKTFGGTSPTSRAAANGYAGPTAFTENIAVTKSGGALPISQAVAFQNHYLTYAAPNVPGRVDRRAILDANFKEIGIGFGARSGYVTPGQNAVLSTYDFGSSTNSAGGRAFITGVVFDDSTDNNFYDVGEGMREVTISAAPVSGGAVATNTTTWAGGGYTLPVSAGTYDVTISGGGLANPVVYHNVVVGAANVKVDASSDQGVWAVNTDGDWGNAANWSGQVPVGAGKVATFANKVVGFRKVNLSADTKVGQVVFSSNPWHYDVTASNGARLILDSGNPTNAARLDDNSGSHGIFAPIRLDSPLEVAVIGTFEQLDLRGAIVPNGAGKTLTKFGRGWLRLGGDNSALNEGVNIVAGDVIVAHPNALGSGPVTFGFGGNLAGLQLESAGLNVTNGINIRGQGNRTISTMHTSGTSRISGPITTEGSVAFFAAGSSRLDVTGGVVRSGTNSTIIQSTGPGTVVVSGPVDVDFVQAGGPGTLVLNSTVATPFWLFASQGVMRLGADQAVVAVSSGAGGRLDLNGKQLRIVSTVFSTLVPELIAQIEVAGGDGIFDSTATTATAIGYRIADDEQSLFVRNVLAGDANLDGAVNFVDLVALAQNYNDTGGKLWEEADFNYDRNVDFLDLVRLAQNYGGSLPAGGVAGAPAGFEAEVARAFASVPEPSLMPLIVGAMGASARRRRRGYYK